MHKDVAERLLWKRMRPLLVEGGGDDPDSRCSSKGGTSAVTAANAPAIAPAGRASRARRHRDAGADGAAKARWMGSERGQAGEERITREE